MPGRHLETGHEPCRIDIDPEFELWIIDLRRPPGTHQLAWLSENERSRSSRFAFERDRRRYDTAHVQLRALLGRRLCMPPHQLEFIEGEFGKPRLRAAPRCSFNLSHSDDVAVLLVGEQGDLGVDVELLRPMPDAAALALRNFSRSENAGLSGMVGQIRDHAFLAAWTRKEACLKAIGSGLSIAPHTFTVGVGHDRCTTVIATPGGLKTVTVQSLCHQEWLMLAWAAVEPPIRP